MADIKLALIKDSIIGDITDRLDFAVTSGGANNTYQPFQAVSSSASSLVYNLQIPSESIVISREVLQQSTVSFTLTIPVNTVPNGATCFNYGKTDAFNAFPLTSLFTTMTSTINNTNVSINIQDVLPSLLRLNNSRELYRYSSFTPSLPDQAYLNYVDGVLNGGANNNPLASYGTASYDVDLVPRGAFPLDRCEVQRYVNGVYADASPVCVSSATDSWKICITATITEPLFLSPFIFGEPEFNCGGFAGINTISAVFNVDSTCKRLWSTALPYISKIDLGASYVASPSGLQPAFQNTRMLLHFLSSQPSDMIPSRVVTPYHDFPRYLTNANNNVAIPAWEGGYEKPKSAQLSSQNIQLNQLPDLFIINVRKPMSTQFAQDADAFFTINNININLNNQSGLLSSASAVDLWKISVSNGSTQTWAEFSGKQSFSDSATGKGKIIASTGSLLIISPSQLSLPDYLSSSSIGQFNFQFNINVTSYFQEDVVPEICTIAVNSGVFVSQMGSSNIYTGVLTKQMVLDAKEMSQVPQMSSSEYKRMVGGQLGNRIASAVGNMTKRLRKKGEQLMTPFSDSVHQAVGKLNKHLR
jgi:hypothetical protein